MSCPNYFLLLLRLIKFEKSFWQPHETLFILTKSLALFILTKSFGSELEILQIKLFKFFPFAKWLISYWYNIITSIKTFKIYLLMFVLSGYVYYIFFRACWLCWLSVYYLWSQFKSQRLLIPRLLSPVYILLAVNLTSRSV